MEKKRKIRITALTIFVIFVLVALFISVEFYYGDKWVPPISGPTIRGDVEIYNGNITIYFVGDELGLSDVKVIIKDVENNYYNTSNIEDWPWNFYESNFFVWSDNNENLKFGNEDSILIYGDNGLSPGIWDVIIVQPSHGRVVYNSNEIEIT
jgi:hypothetical protein